MALIKKLSLWGILAFFLFSSLLAQGNYRISDLSISGNKSISEGKLKKQLSLKDRSSWQKLLFWNKANQYHEADLISDLELMKNLYQKEGFLDVQIDSEIKQHSAEESVEIELIIQMIEAGII